MRKLFEIIAEGKNKKEFYSTSIDVYEDIEDYIDSITRYTPNDSILIEADCHNTILKDTIPDLSAKKLNVDGLLLYYYILHDDDFAFMRIRDYDELLDFIYENISNRFIGDIIVIENGKRKKYFIKDSNGQVLNWCWDISKIVEKRSFTLEWFDINSAM